MTFQVDHRNILRGRNDFILIPRKDSVALVHLDGDYVAMLYCILRDVENIWKTKTISRASNNRTCRSFLPKI